jgi:3'(2'), 5'-bisphosphate nucleotidase
MAAAREHERRVAELAVWRACDLTKRVLHLVSEFPKNDATPVTIADFAAQALIIYLIHREFPDDRFVGEEGTAELRHNATLRAKVWELVRGAAAESESGSAVPAPASEEEMLAMIDLGGNGEGGRQGRFWFLDPVDGTRSFLEGHQYAISLALIEDGREVLGVLACPNLRLDNGRVRETSVDNDGLGVMVSAVKGQGATLRHLSRNGELPQPTPLERLRLPAPGSPPHVVDSKASKATRHDIVERVVCELGGSYPGTDVWSSHMRYASLILGGADFLLRVPVPGNPHWCVWDHAGSQLIFTELGGKITDLDGKEIDFGAGRHLSANNGMLVAKEGMHGQILEMTRRMLKEEEAARTR